MEDKYVRNSLRFFIGVLLLVVLYSCANIASPNGGPYDEAPPKFVSSTPLPGQINYKGKKVEIIFDELIQIDKPTENVIITPIIMRRMYWRIIPLRSLPANPSTVWRCPESC